MKHSIRSTSIWRSATRKVLAITIAFALTIGALPMPLVQIAPALAAGNCATSSPPSAAYSIQLCFTSPTDGETVSGDRTVTVSRTVSGTAPSYNSLVYSLDNLNDPNDAPYMLTAFATPSASSSPHRALLQRRDVPPECRGQELTDLNTLQGPTITVNLANGVVTPPGSGNSFAKVNGPAAGPIVLAAVGDGPDGASNAMKVRT